MYMPVTMLRKRIPLRCLIAALLLSLTAVRLSAHEDEAWQAGTEVCDSLLRAQSVAEWFTAGPLPAHVVQRMQGRSYPEGCPVPLADLRYLCVLHVDAEGRTLRGELVCNKAIAQDLLYIFRRLYAERYPIERMRLIDDYGADDERSMQANNTSAFCYRRVAGSSRLSAHARGMAVDINPLYNPCVRRMRNGKTLVQPATAERYVQRHGQLPYMMSADDLCVRMFRRRGFRWGGAWRTVKDYQHFEK